MSASFKPLPDFDASKMYFSVVVPSKTVVPSKMPTAQLTTFKQFGELGYAVAYDKETEEAFGTYVYSHFVSTPGGCEFVFVSPRTSAQSQQPVLHLTTVETDVYPWPSVINWIVALEHRDRPLQYEVKGKRIELPSLSLRMSKLRGGNYPCVHKTEYFVSHRPFPESFLKTNVPVPGSVYAQIRNLTIDEFALHPEIKLPPPGIEGTMLPGFGYVPSGINIQSPEVIPQTNHLRWKKHVAREKVQQINGLFVMERLTVKPPKNTKKYLSII